MDELSEMTVEKFKIWSLNALKVYLSRRNKPVDGNLDELSARAFCAWEENLPVDVNAELAEQRLQHEYKAKLNIKGDVIPDPFSLTSGWKGMNLSMFWTKHVFHAICELKTQNENNSPTHKPTGTDPNVDVNNNKIPVASKPNMSAISTSSLARRALIPLCLPSSKRKNTGRKAEAKTLVFLCGVCGLDVLDNPQSEDEQSVQCDSCSIWTHYVCAGATDTSLSASPSWFC